MFFTIHIILMFYFTKNLSLRKNLRLNACTWKTSYLCGMFKHFLLYNLYKEDRRVVQNAIC